MDGQLKMEGLSKGHANEEKRAKRNWENAFQKWSDKKAKMIIQTMANADMVQCVTTVQM